MDEFDFREYKEIRDEAEKFVERILTDIPENFTMLHLECTKNILQSKIDEILGYHKSKTKLFNI